MYETNSVAVGLEVVVVEEPCYKYKTYDPLITQHLQGLHRNQSNFIDSFIVLPQLFMQMHRSPVLLADYGLLRTKETLGMHLLNGCNSKVAIAKSDKKFLLV